MSNNNYMKKLIIFTILSLTMLLPVLVLAAPNINEYTGITANSAGFDSSDVAANAVSSKIGGIIQVILGFVGTLFLVLTVYAGILWMTASGNEEQVKKATGILKMVVTGIVIVSSAFIIVTTVGQFADPGQRFLLNQQTSMAGQVAGFDVAADSRTTALSNRIGMIIKILLTFVGTLFMVLTVVAGFMWMTASGNEDRVKKAIDILKMAVIGLIISIAAFSISVMVTGYAFDISSKATPAPASEGVKCDGFFDCLLKGAESGAADTGAALGSQ